MKDIRRAIDVQAPDRPAIAQPAPEHTTAGAVAAARELGERLTAHVRMEEHELFPLIEQTLPASELERLARRLQDDAE